MTEWSKVFDLKSNMLKHRGFKSHYFLMLIFYFNIILLIENILVLFIIDEERLFNLNFYIEDISYSSIGIIHLFPEIWLIVAILYNLVSFLNDIYRPIFLVYRWFNTYIMIFIFLFVYFNYCILPQYKIILGFSWINCVYISVSKIIILLLTLINIWVSKKKIKTLTALNIVLEFPLILSFSILFMFFLTSSYDFFCVYVSIEGLSLTLYVLSAILHKSLTSVEATIKYFSLGAISTGILLLGISIIFALVGSLDFLEIQLFLGGLKSYFHFFEIKFGFILILFSFLFKISAFPCHIWVADVYEGIWTPITLFFAVVIKVCLILFFSRLIFNVLFNIIFCFQFLLSFVAVGSMVIGAFGALKQVRIKRFIAYASINQVGFFILGIASSNLIGLISIFIYIIAYAIMNILFFSILLNTEHFITQRSMIYLSDLYIFTLSNNQSSKYLVLTLMSMAGLPPLGGFVGKLFLYFATIEARLDFVLIISLTISVLSTYYYLNIIKHILFEKCSNLKLYYYIKNINTKIILNFLAISLLLFFLLPAYIWSFLVSIAMSCVWPLIWY